MDEFEREWYSSDLQAAREPSLFEASSGLVRSGVGVVRFTWLRSFHRPVVVRVKWTASRRPRLVATELSGKGGYDPGVPVRRIDRPLTRAEALELRDALVRARVFALPPKNCDLGGDGAQWLLEGVDRQGYHFVGRWSPTRGPVRDLGLSMLSLTGWRFDEIY